MEHVGIDVHEKYSEICILTAEGTVKKRLQVATTEASFGRLFRRRLVSRIVFECGLMSPWVYRILRGWGHDVIVVNPRKVRLIAESTLKSDRIDAEVLARLSLYDRGFLQCVYQRSEGAQLLRTRLRVRSSLANAPDQLGTGLLACPGIPHRILRSAGVPLALCQGEKRRAK